MDGRRLRMMRLVLSPHDGRQQAFQLVMAPLGYTWSPTVKIALLTPATLSSRAMLSTSAAVLSSYDVPHTAMSPAPMSTDAPANARISAGASAGGGVTSTGGKQSTRRSAAPTTAPFNAALRI